MWTKLATLFQLTGAVFTIPVGLAGVYSAYRTNLSTEVACQNLRTSILGVLERQVDVNAKRVLVQKDMAAFERTCAQSDPDAKAVFAALDRTILFVPKAPDAAAEPRDSAPVRFVPPPPPRPLGEPPFHGRGPYPFEHRHFENKPRGI